MHNYKKPHLNRLRVTIDCSEPVLTKQADAQTSDINFLVKQFLKTGYITPPSTAPVYADVSQIQGLGASITQLHEAKNAFLSLPSDLRATLGHDYRKLEPWLLNPSNWKEAARYGLVKLPLESESGGHSKTPQGSSVPKEQPTS